MGIKGFTQAVHYTDLSHISTHITPYHSHLAHTHPAARFRRTLLPGVVVTQEFWLVLHVTTKPGLILPLE